MIAILFGNEPYAIDVRKKRYLKDISDVSHFEGDFTEDVLLSCRTFSFFSDKRAVVLHADALRALDCKAFYGYLEAPEDKTTLLVICREADRRTKIYKTLQKAGVLVPCDKLKTEAELQKVLLYELKKHGAQITRGAMGEFIKRLNYFEHADMNLLQAAQYVHVLASVTKEITEHTVKTYVPSFETADVFQLSSLIAKGDANALMRTLVMLPDSDAIKVLSLILREIRIAYKLHFFHAEDIGIRNAVFQDRPREVLVKALDTVNDAIEGIKQGRFTESIALRMGCIKAMHLLNS